MSEITCAATISEETIKLDLDGNTISISLDGDIDFTTLAKNLTILIERESSISITWADAEEPTDKAKIAKEVIDKIIDSFNEVIEEQFDEEDESH
jgi:Mg2+ and Co2+ transporter CorA